MLENARLTVLVGLGLLLVLGLGVGEVFLSQQVGKSCAGRTQVVERQVVVTPTLEPTATPSAVLRVPVKTVTTAPVR